MTDLHQRVQPPLAALVLPHPPLPLLLPLLLVLSSLVVLAQPPLAVCGLCSCSAVPPYTIDCTDRSLDNAIPYIDHTVHNLILQRCGIRQVPAEAFAAATALQQLSLANNFITSIHSLAFANLSNLRSLDLSSNGFTSFPATLLQPVPNLLTLSMASLTTTVLPWGFFDHVPQLIKLDLSGRGALAIITGDELRAFKPGLFDRLTRLEDLDTARNWHVVNHPFRIFDRLGPTLHKYNTPGTPLVTATYTNPVYFDKLRNLKDIRVEGHGLKQPPNLPPLPLAEIVGYFGINLVRVPYDWFARFPKLSYTDDADFDGSFCYKEKDKNITCTCAPGFFGDNTYCEQPCNTIPPQFTSAGDGTSRLRVECQTASFYNRGYTTADHSDAGFLMADSWCAVSCLDTTLQLLGPARITCQPFGAWKTDAICIQPRPSACQHPSCTCYANFTVRCADDAALQQLPLIPANTTTLLLEALPNLKSDLVWQELYAAGGQLQRISMTDVGLPRLNPLLFSASLNLSSFSLTRTGRLASIPNTISIDPTAFDPLQPLSTFQIVGYDAVTVMGGLRELFRYTPAVEHLTLRNISQLGAIVAADRTVFQQMPWLKTMDLRWNRLTYLPYELFHASPDLSMVLLDGNDDLLAIDNDIFERQGWIPTVNATVNGFRCWAEFEPGPATVSTTTATASAMSASSSTSVVPATTSSSSSSSFSSSASPPPSSSVAANRLRCTCPNDLRTDPTAPATCLPICAPFAPAVSSIRNPGISTSSASSTTSPPAAGATSLSTSAVTTPVPSTSSSSSLPATGPWQLVNCTNAQGVALASNKVDAGGQCVAVCRHALAINAQTPVFSSPASGFYVQRCHQNKTWSTTPAWACPATAADGCGGETILPALFLDPARDITTGCTHAQQPLWLNSSALQALQLQSLFSRAEALARSLNLQASSSSNLLPTCSVSCISQPTKRVSFVCVAGFWYQVSETAPTNVGAWRRVLTAEEYLLSCPDVDASGSQNQDSGASALGLGVGLTIALVSIGLIVAFFVMRRKHRKGRVLALQMLASEQDSAQQRQRVEAELERANALLQTLANSGGSGGGGGRGRLVPRAALTREDELGSGNFGVVWRGTLASSETTSGSPMRVAVKELHSGAGLEEEAKFLLECQLMVALRHEGLVTMIGICAEASPPWLILEYMAGGDLRSQLLRYRNVAEVAAGPKPSTVKPYDVCHIAVQVAGGLAYLEANRIVHRDLACRNLLVGSSLRSVKVGDYGLSRILAQNVDYYRKTSHSQLPVRWMAPESIERQRWTSRSDVWSYAVTMWEVAALGHVPHGALDTVGVVRAILQGVPLERPLLCTKPLYEMLLDCWHVDPVQRPSFEQLFGRVKKLLNEMPREDKTSGQAGGAGENEASAYAYEKDAATSGSASAYDNESELGGVAVLEPAADQLPGAATVENSASAGQGFQSGVNGVVHRTAGSGVDVGAGYVANEMVLRLQNVTADESDDLDEVHL